VILGNEINNWSIGLFYKLFDVLCRAVMPKPVGAGWYMAG